MRSICQKKEHQEGSDTSFEIEEVDQHAKNNLNYRLSQGTKNQHDNVLIIHTFQMLGNFTFFLINVF